MGGIELYREYKRAFGIEETAVLAIFEELLGLSHRNLEYSAKLDEAEQSFTRFALIFDHELEDRLRQIDLALERIAQLPSVKLDRSLYRRLTHRLTPSNTTLCAIGIDARATAEASRLKVWASVVDDPEKVNDLLDAHGHDGDFLQLVPGNVLLAGVDLSLTGKSRMKLYPKYTAPELANVAVRWRLSRVLCPEAMAWMSHVRRANITLDEDGERTIHLQPIDAAAMLASIHHPALAEVDARYRALGLRLNVVSVPERELKSGRHDHLNLYYVE